jgi:hypothetical protein
LDDDEWMGWDVDLNKREAGKTRDGFASCLSTATAEALTGAHRPFLPMFVKGATPAGTMTRRPCASFYVANNRRAVGRLPVQCTKKVHLLLGRACRIRDVSDAHLLTLDH